MSEYSLRVYQRNGRVQDWPYLGQLGREHVRAEARTHLHPDGAYLGADKVEIVRSPGVVVETVEAVRS